MQKVSSGMDHLLRKFTQKYKRAREELNKWDSSQAKLLNLFGNAISILERLPMLIIPENFGVLQDVDHMTQALPAKQMESLENIFVELHKTLDELKRVRDALEKLLSESRQLVRAEKPKSTSTEGQQRFGVGPNPIECIRGLENLYIMHRDEYNLKVSIVQSLTYNSSTIDMIAMQSVLAEQPNLPPDEVQFIFKYFNTSNSS